MAANFSFEQQFYNLIETLNINGVFSDPIYTSLTIIFITMLLFYWIFRSIIPADEPFWAYLFRYGIYALLPVTLGIFINYKLTERAFEIKHGDKTTDAIVSDTIRTDTAPKPTPTAPVVPSSPPVVLNPAPVVQSTPTNPQQ